MPDCFHLICPHNYTLSILHFSVIVRGVYEYKPHSNFLKKITTFVMQREVSNDSENCRNLHKFVAVGFFLQLLI